MESTHGIRFGVRTAWRGDQIRIGVLLGAGPCAEPMLVLSIPEGLHPEVYIHTRVVLEEMPSEGSCVRLVQEQLHLVEGTLL